jgi:hypothetical protein
LQGEVSVVAERRNIESFIAADVDQLRAFGNFEILAVDCDLDQ